MLRCFTLNGTSEEPHMQASNYSSKLVREADLLNIWTVKHPNVRK